ncbi:MAG: AarF/ABC1/UbiB kinase family protein [Oligoflexia bacterium]|nr:AarF/ABC1/UbiB kinase family protein [Oligoflexia bacterium]
MAKQLKKIKESSLSRSLNLALLGIQTGLKLAENRITKNFLSQEEKEKKAKNLLISQIASLAGELGELKGTLMKAGQMLSVYGEHFLPKEANAFLKTLQSDSSFLEWKQIEKILKKELSESTYKKIEIEREPIAAASIAQVHRAVIKRTNLEIVLKVQYPGVERAIDGDLKNLKRILSLLQWLPKIPETENLFKEMKYMMKREVNYLLEEENLSFFRKKLEGDPLFILPESYPELSSKRVLALSYMPGLKVDSDEVLNLPQKIKNQIASSLLDLYFRELFVWNKVQTDPHFGNYRIRLENESAKVILYDFGSVRDVSQTFLKSYKNMLTALVFHEQEAFEVAAEKLGVLNKNDPQELKSLFTDLCTAIVEPFSSDKEYDWHQSQDLPKRVSDITWKIFKRFPLRSPPREVLFLDRKMAGMFTFLSVLNAKFNSREVLLKYLDRNDLKNSP